MGALSAGQYSLKQIQDGLVDFLTEYSTITNKTDSLVKLMFLYFSVNQGTYTVWAFAHAIFLAAMGLIDAWLILTYVDGID